MSVTTRKRIKAAIAIVLLPFCLGTASAVVRIFANSGASESIWIATVAGMACWLVIYLMLPKPMWIYVLGHELTHAVWTWGMGGKVKRFKATAKGGHVVVTRKNFLVALAPYFFPIYAVIIVGVFCIGNWLWGWKHHSVWLHLLLGAAYAFHLTLTWWIIRTRQTDIVEQGYLFSAVVIWLGNAGVLVMAVPLLTGRVSVMTALGWCWIETGRVFQQLGRAL